MRKPYRVFEGQKHVATCKDKREAINFVRAHYMLTHVLNYRRSSFAPIKTIDGKVIYICKAL